jgi:hypothetical protein
MLLGVQEKKDLNWANAQHAQFRGGYIRKVQFEEVCRNKILFLSF